MEAGAYLKQWEGAKQGSQADRVVGQATGERRGVTVQNGSPEHFFELHFFSFPPKPLQGEQRIYIIIFLR